MPETSMIKSLPIVLFELFFDNSLNSLIPFLSQSGLNSSNKILSAPAKTASFACFISSASIII